MAATAEQAKLLEEYKAAVIQAERFKIAAGLEAAISVICASGRYSYPALMELVKAIRNGDM